MPKTALTSPMLMESSSQETYGINQSINQYKMLGSIYEPGLVDTMLATDPTIQIGKLAITAAMSQAQIALEPCGCKPEIFEFVNEMFFKRLATRFQDVFLSTLEALFYGVAPSEVTIDYRHGHWVITDISARPARGFDLYNIKKKPGQWWIEGKYQWYTSDGSLKTVECGGPEEKGKALIWWPVWGGGLLGRSILRPVVSEHLEKQQIRLLRGASLKKVLFGTPILHAKPRTADQDDLNPDDVIKTQLALAKAATGNASCLYIPSDFDAPDVLYASDSGLAKSIETEKALDIQILMSMGAAGLAKGLLVNGYSSSSSGDADEQLQDSIRQYFFNFFSASIQELVDWIIDLDFGPQWHYPELVVSSPSILSTSQLARTYAQLVAAGGIQPCTADEDMLRRVCRLPQQNGELIDKDKSKSQDIFSEVRGHYDSKTGLDTRDPDDRSESYFDA